MNSTDIDQVEPGFGMRALNRALGTIRDGKRYVFQAAAGRAQHLLTLQLVRAAIADGGAVLVLTIEDPDSLLLQGQTMGLDITQPLAIGRLTIVRYAEAFRDLANMPSRSASLLEAWVDQLRAVRPNRVVFLGWPRTLDHDVKLLGILEQLEHLAVNEARAACFHLMDPADADRYAHDVRRRAFAEVRFDTRGATTHADIVRGPVPEHEARFDLCVEPGVGFVDAPPARPMETPRGPRVERVLSRS